MDKKITELARDPFSVILADQVLSLVVDSRSGNVLIYGAALMAWKGLVFSLIPGSTGQVLRLQYGDITIDVGWTDDVAEAASWVAAVNKFLETKREGSATNGRNTPPVPVVSGNHDNTTRAVP